jgi:ankyrin repeat protein
MEASEKGHVEIIKTLARFGAKLNIVNVNGNGALFRACRKGQLAAAEELLIQGANIEIRNQVIVCKFNQTN